MREVSKNQHRWKRWLDELSVRIVEDLGELLDWSWKRDSDYPKSYPVNTLGVFRQFHEQLSPKHDRKSKRRGLRRPPPVRDFADLFHEADIKFIYEQQHDDLYSDALKIAAARNLGSSKAFHNLMKAAKASYDLSRGGEQYMPKPKIHFLHRELLEIAVRLALDDLTNDGLQEFFEDICPCGKKHNAEAIRKLKKRKARY